MCRIFRGAWEDEQLGGEKSGGEAGVCVRARVHMCQHKCANHAGALVVVDSHYGGTNPEARERTHFCCPPTLPCPQLGNGTAS